MSKKSISTIEPWTFRNIGFLRSQSRLWLTWEHPTSIKLLSTSFVLFLILSSSVNFKKNEKVYNPEKSEVLKALQENDSEPEPGNEATDSDVRKAREDDGDDRYSHYYALAFMLKLLNGGDGNGSLFSNDKLIE